MNRVAASLLTLTLLVACGDDSDPMMDGGIAMDGGGGMDGATDAGSPDAISRDGGSDAGPTDAGPAGMCGDIECRHCVSRGACVSPIDDCALEELPLADECSRIFSPCGVASCWQPTLSIPMCSARLVDEDFSSGNYNVHRYDATVPGGEALTLTLRRAMSRLMLNFATVPSSS